MDSRVKQLWIDRLRSGAKQARGALCDAQGGGRCCLGLLCDLYIEDLGPEANGKWVDGDFVWKEDLYERSDDAELPEPVRIWAGLDDPCPEIGDFNAIQLNDGEKDSFRTIEPHSFPEIADLVDKHL